jgi:hypothetical protein
MMYLQVDYAEISDHIFYDRHCHTLPTSKALRACHARYGKETEKQAGSRQIRSFCEALRQCNTRFSDGFLSLLQENPSSSVAIAMGNIIATNRLFGGNNSSSSRSCRTALYTK